MKKIIKSIRSLLLLSILSLSFYNFSHSIESKSESLKPLFMDLNSDLPDYKGINCWKGYENILDNLKDAQDGTPPKIDKDEIAACLMQSAKTTYPPLIFATSVFNDNSKNSVMKGIEIASNRLGNYGP